MVGVKPPWTDLELELARALIKAGHNYREVAEELEKQLGSTRTHQAVREKFRSRRRANADQSAQELRNNPSTGSVEPELTTTIGSDGGIVQGTTAEQVKTLEDLIRVCQIDENLYEVVAWSARSFSQGYKDNNGVGRVQQLYSVSAKLRPWKETDLKKQLEGVLSDIEQAAKLVVPTLIPSPTSSGYAMTAYIPDLHLGKMAWAPETGNHYDSDIAAHLYLSSVRALLQDATNYDLERIILPIGSDMLNVDSEANTTTGGTPQDVDGRHKKVFRRAVQLIRSCIEEIILPAGHQVQLFCIRGNHDEMSSFYLGEVLRTFYADWPDVSFEDNIRPRQYWQWGKNLIMFAHGDTEKSTDLPLIMAQEMSKVWGETEYREIHTGHLHRAKQTRYVALIDKQGVIHEEFPSLSGLDAWHSRKGYNSLRSAKAIVYSKEHGRSATFERHASQFLGPDTGILVPNAD